MKKVLLFTSFALAGFESASAETQPSDSLKIFDLDEIIVNATKAVKGTPMAFTDISKEQLKTNKYGPDIP